MARPRSKTKLTCLNFKVSSKDRKTLVAMSQQYMNGNLSAWLRFAGMNFKPPKVKRLEKR